MKTILVVDDNKSILELISIYLTDYLHYQVYLAETVSEALEKIQRLAHLDLVLVDYYMDDGQICAPIVKAAQNNTKVVIITAASEKNEDIEKATGITNVLRKPFNIDELETTVKQAIGV